LSSVARGDLVAREEATHPRAALSVVMAAEGYPGSPRTGDVIEGLESVQNATVLHAGTKRLDDGSVVTAGGRVLNVVGEGATLREAADHAYAAVSRIRFRGAHNRLDIGHRALRR
jgi:phosphoribosylamine--glycine ligase